MKMPSVTAVNINCIDLQQKQSQVLRSHYRNYGEHKGLAVLNSELSKLSPQILSVTLRNFTQGIFSKIFQSSHITFCGYWHRLEN